MGVEQREERAIRMNSPGSRPAIPEAKRQNFEKLKVSLFLGVLERFPRNFLGGLDAWWRGSLRGRRGL